MIKVIVNDIELDLRSDTVVALTRKSASIGSLQNRFSSFTNKFTVPATKKNRDALGVRQFEDFSGSQYQEQVGKIVSGGIEIATNVTVIIEQVSTDITLSIRAGNGTLFDKLNKWKLRDLDWSGDNHIWNASNVAASDTHDYTDTYVYPLSQTGNQSVLKNTVQANGLIPFVFVKAIYEKIGSEFGYSWTGSSYSDQFFEYLLMPISNLKIGSSFAASLGVSRGVFVTTYNGSIDTGFGFDLNLFGGIDTWLLSISQLNNNTTPFQFITSPTGLGSLSNGYYVPLAGMYRLTYNYDIDVTSKVINGTHYFQLLVQKRNGLSVVKTIAFKNFDLTTPAIDVTVNYTGTITLDFTIDEEDLNFYNQDANDFVVALVKFHELVTPPGYAIIKTNGNSFVVEPIAIEKTTYGRPISLGDHLPDWTLGKFIKEVGNIFAAFYDVNEFTKEIEIIRLDEIAANKVEAVDWSDKLDLSFPAEVSYILDGIGRTTTWQWKDDLIYTKTIQVANEQLPDVQKYLESDASFSLGLNIAAKTTPVISIPVWDSEKRIISMDGIPRFAIYRSEASSVNIFGTNIGDPNTSVTKNPYPAAYFDYDNSPYSLDWSELYDDYFWQLLVPMIDRVQKVTAYFKLNDLDIQSFRFKYPVFISKFNRYFFVDEIAEYTGSEQSTKVVLIGI
jgi:hypothetical protein